MKGVNQVIAMGNLGKDADVKATNSGSKVANISLGCSYSVKSGDGSWDDRTEWVRCVVWNPSDWLISQMRKGRPMHVTGRLQTRSWDDQNGNKRYATEVVVQASNVIPCNPIRNDQLNNQSAQVQHRQPAQPPPASSSQRPREDIDDEIPFAFLIGSGIALAQALLQTPGILA